MRALIASADEFEDTELLVPLYRFQEEGIAVEVASPAVENILASEVVTLGITRITR